MGIALIEINENDIEGLKIPFTIYAIYKDTSAAKIRALYKELAEKRKEIGNIYKKIDELKESESD